MIPVAREAVPALQSITSGIGPLLPVVAGLRPFMPDLIGGFFDGVAANNGGTYDANGHYLRVSPSAGQGGGLTGLLPPLQPLPVLAQRSGADRSVSGRGDGACARRLEPVGPAGVAHLQPEAGRGGAVRRIGALLVVLAAVATAATVLPRPARGDSSYTFAAIFDDARGIIPGQLLRRSPARTRARSSRSRSRRTSRRGSR